MTFTPPGAPRRWWDRPETTLPPPPKGSSRTFSHPPASAVKKPKSPADPEIVPPRLVRLAAMVDASIFGEETRQVMEQYGHIFHKEPPQWALINANWIEARQPIPTPFPHHSHTQQDRPCGVLAMADVLARTLEKQAMA
jgi:hypothetical protein